MKSDRIVNLENKHPNIEILIAKHFDRFVKDCRRYGTKYDWRGYISTEIREVLLMGVLSLEDIDFSDVPK